MPDIPQSLGPVLLAAWLAGVPADLRAPEVPEKAWAPSVRAPEAPDPPRANRQERPAAPDTLVLEDFEDDPVGGLPVGWSWKASDDAKPKPYRVRQEANGNKYLEATDEGESVILAKEVAWDLEEYPYVSFRLRIHEIPEGGDERYDDTVDSAAGIYFIYRRKAFGKIPESVKYVWSSTLPVGTATRREGVGRPWMIVIGSGREGLGEWHTYVFDLREAYRKTFRGKPPRRPVGIAILSDANSTHSRAYADYDDILALRVGEPGTTSGVERILRPSGRHRR